MSLAIFDNFKVKLVAFLFAFFIWFFVITDNTYEHVVDVQVQVTNMPEGKVLLSDIPNTVKVKIKGSGKELIGLSLGRGGRVELDLTDVERKKTFAINPENILFSRPAGNTQAIEVLMPDSVTVLLDDFLQRSVPVEPQSKPKAAPGYTIVGEIQVRPDSVAISGPRSVISQIENLPTVDTKHTDLKHDLVETIPLAPLPDRVVAETKTVQIHLNIQKLVEITKSGIPIKVINVPPNRSVRVVPSTLSLVLEGGGDLLSTVSRDDIKAYIDYNRVKDSPADAHPAVIVPPPGVSYRDVEPRTFRLVFENRASN